MQLLTPRVLRDSPLGRRFLGVLVVAALAPITLLAVLADLQMSSTVGAQRDAELSLSARNVASGIIERLRRIDELIAATQPQLASGATLSQVRWNSALAAHHRDVVALAKLDAAGLVVETAGDFAPKQVRIDTLADTQRDALLRGRSVVLTPAGPGTPVTLVVPIASPSASARYLAAAVSPDYLWGGADKIPGMTTLCVVAGSRKIDCPSSTVGEPPLSQARVVFEGQQRDVWASAWSDRTPGFERAFVSRGLDFYRNELFLLEGSSLKPVPKPADAQVTFWKERALMRLRSDWKQGERVWPAGSLLVMSAAALMEGKPDPVALFTPTAQRSLAGYTTTATSVVLSVMQDVTGRLEVRRPEGNGWTTRTIPVPNTGTLSVAALHDPSVDGDEWAESLLVSYTDLLTPESLLLARADRAGLENLKARQGLFSTQGLRLDQRFAVSKDGTRIPYFIVEPTGPRTKGPKPTLLYGYGGFDISMRSTYSGGIGRGWLARGGVYVVANIRGGGEYGPTWHTSAIRENKQRSYDDFIAVAEDLIKTGVTTPAQLGIRGGSNGGLLVGAVMVQRPDLFGAVVCQVPLLDMRRFHRLLAGASWMAEYGNPDLEADWAFISRYSPYHNIPPASGDGARKLPAMLLITSTRDDRVHPGHARKMAARLTERGQSVLYWENIEGGHSGAADNGQRARMQALEYTFLWRQLAGPVAPSGTVTSTAPQTGAGR